MGAAYNRPFFLTLKQKEINTMLSITKTYKDFNGQSRTEDFLFHLTKAEILDMELSENGGFSTILRKLSARQDIKEIISIFRKLVRMAYGEKSADGRTFVKNDQITENFVSTNAYADIYYDLVTDPDKAAAFINGIVPEDIREQMGDVSKDPLKLAEAANTTI